MKLAFAFVALVLLSSCSDDKQKPASVDEKKAARMAKAEQQLSQPPTQTIHNINGNQLIVIDFPVRIYKNDVDTKRCFVWRDTEFKTSNMTCEQEDTASGVNQ